MREFFSSYFKQLKLLSIRCIKWIRSGSPWLILIKGILVFGFITFCGTALVKMWLITWNMASEILEIMLLITMIFMAVFGNDLTIHFQKAREQQENAQHNLNIEILRKVYSAVSVAAPRYGFWKPSNMDDLRPSNTGNRYTFFILCERKIIEAIVKDPFDLYTLIQNRLDTIYPYLNNRYPVLDSIYPDTNRGRIILTILSVNYEMRENIIKRWSNRFASKGISTSRWHDEDF